MNRYFCFICLYLLGVVEVPTQYHGPSIDELRRRYREKHGRDLEVPI